jgi:hypothetical protein
MAAIKSRNLKKNPNIFFKFPLLIKVLFVTIDLSPKTKRKIHSKAIYKWLKLSWIRKKKV